MQSNGVVFLLQAGRMLIPGKRFIQIKVRSLFQNIIFNKGIDLSLPANQGEQIHIQNN